MRYFSKHFQRQAGIVSGLSRVLTACLFFIICIVAESKDTVALSSIERRPQVCRDDRGNIATGELDVLTIFDNSRSLAKTDPGGQRFVALEEFLRSFATTPSATKKNFGLIRFGGSASEVIALDEVTQDNVSEIVNLVRDRIPNDINKQERFTNYIKALQEALRTFDERPSNNCKVLIWFTDGVFDTTDSRQPAEDQKESSELRNAVCGNGLGAEIRSRRISTFVVYLTPGATAQDGYVRRTEASKDVLQVITGDMKPDFDGAGADDRKTSDDCAVGDLQLGEVLAAKDANLLIGYLLDLVEVAGGGQSVAGEQECPYQANEVGSLEMPSPYFIEWLSVVSWGDNVDVKNLKIELRSGEEPITNFFEASESSDLAARTLRLRPRPDAYEALEAGWTLKIGEARDLCVRAKAVDLEFRISRAEPPIVVSAPPELRGLPSNEFKIDRLKFFTGGNSTASDREIDFDTALTLSDVKGKLEIDSGEVLAADSMIPVRIVVDGQFRLQPSDCELNVIVLNQQKEGERLTSSSSCQVIPSTTSTTRVDGTASLAELEQRCGVGRWSLVKQDAGGEESNFVAQEFDRDSTPFNLSLRTVEAVPDGSIKCQVSDVAVKVSSGGVEDALEIRVQLDLLPKPNALWPLIAALLVGLLTAASLAILRVVNQLTARAPQQGDFFGYIATGELLRGERSRATFRWAESSGPFSADPKALVPATGDNGRSYIGVGRHRFVRRLPPLLRPFEQARLVLGQAEPAVFWKSNSQRDGLPLSFAAAIAIVGMPSRQSSSESPSIPVEAIVLVPRRGALSGFSGVEKVMRDQLADLAPLLEKTIQESASIASPETPGISSVDTVKRPESPPTEAGADHAQPRPPAPPVTRDVSRTGQGHDAPPSAPSRPASGGPPGPPRRT